MELGALVCTPRSPRCGECPVAALCPTRRLGLQDVIPRPKAKPSFENVREGAVLVAHRDGRRVLLVQRAAGSRWAGLWDFPRFTLAAKRKTAAVAELRRLAETSLGLKLDVGELAGTLKYGVTRFRITLDAYRARALGGRLKPRGFAAARWVRPDDLAEYPLNVSARKLAKLVES
jgi:A/G-specific adenine glycosylase